MNIYECCDLTKKSISSEQPLMNAALGKKDFKRTPLAIQTLHIINFTTFSEITKSAIVSLYYKLDDYYLKKPKISISLKKKFHFAFIISADSISAVLLFHF